MEYLEKSEEITGHRVKIRERDAFNVTGYTIIVPPEFGSELSFTGSIDRETA